MSFRVVIEEEAERELAAAVDFYDERDPGVGQRFAKDLQLLFKTVSENSERFPFASRLTQKAKMPRPWPYSIYFVARRQSSEIIITNIWHGARNPAGLKRRLR